METIALETRPRWVARSPEVTFDYAREADQPTNNAEKNVIGRRGALSVADCALVRILDAAPKPQCLFLGNVRRLESLRALSNSRSLTPPPLLTTPMISPRST